MTCTGCFNSNCPECAGHWTGDCQTDFEAEGMAECKSDQALEAECGNNVSLCSERRRLSVVTSGLHICPVPSTMPGGRWECPGLAATAASVKQGMSCMLFCDDTFAGSKTCSYEGWQDTPAPGNAGVDCGCHMSESCLWQTCRYGNSSQEWSVNCGLGDAGCLAAVAGAGLEAECDEFTGAGDCLLGCEVDILLLLFYY